MPHDKNYYTAGDMARMFSLSRQTLLYYDKIGLLKPEYVSENGYRHYSLHQYLELEIISNFRKIDVPIEEIQEYLNHRSPEALRRILKERHKQSKEIIKLNQNICKDIESMYEQLDEIDESLLDQFTLSYRHEKKLYMSRITTARGNKAIVPRLSEHNSKAFSEHHFKDSRVGWVIEKDRFLTGESGMAIAYFSNVSENYYNEQQEYYTMPGGLYLTLRFKGTFHVHKRELAEKFNEFLEGNSLHPVGNLFVQPLKNYWMCMTQEEYITQISMQVERIEE